MTFRIETGLATRLPRDDEGRHGGFRLNEDIDVSDAQVLRQVCTRGWAGPEADGVWSQEIVAQLLFQHAEGSDEKIALWLAAMPFVTDTHAQLFDISWNGIAVGRVRLDSTRIGRQVFKILRPPELAGEEWARIDLLFRAASSPEQEGLSGDARPLGLKLARAAFAPADAPPPPLFEGPALIVAGEPAVLPAADTVARLEAKCDRILDELRAARLVADRLARVLDRIVGVAAELRPGE